MRKTKWYSVIQLVVIILSFLTSALLSFSHQKGEVNLEGYADFLKKELEQEQILVAYEEANQIVSEAYDKARSLFQDNLVQCREFVDDLLNDYLESADKDFIVIYIPEGLGCYSVEESEQAKSLIGGITSTLETWDYSCIVLTFQRTQPGLRGMIDETSNTLKSPTHKIEVLAAGIDFLTQQLPESKIILVGLSQGAAFSSEVMKLLSDNPQAYSIEAGIPFYTEPFQSERNFVINCNGITPDALSEGNFGGLAQAYLSAPFKWLSSKIQGNEIKRPGDYIQIPGHWYSWDYPEVSYQITEFLTDNFYPE